MHSPGASTLAPAAAACELRWKIIEIEAGVVQPAALYSEPPPLAVHKLPLERPVQRAARRYPCVVGAIRAVPRPEAAKAAAPPCIASVYLYKR